ncbi:MAG: bacteriochlorophyll 4-vinyl reductase [Pseudomonadota bacterium]
MNRTQRLEVQAKEDVMGNVIADRLIHPVLARKLVGAARDTTLPVDVTRPAKIGPNAILQLIAVMREEQHDRWLRDIFYRSGLSAMLLEPPTEMVDETAVADLYKALFERLPPAAASRIAAKAGIYTARYILAHRIPKPVKIILKLLPSRWSAPLLLRAIQRHAWTFAGSGKTSVVTGNELAIEIAANPIAMPGCVWHGAVFETLLRRLVSAKASVRHTDCCRDGAPACRFEIALSDRQR